MVCNDIIIFDGGGGVAHFSALRHRRYKLTLEKLEKRYVIARHLWWRRQSSSRGECIALNLDEDPHRLAAQVGG